MPLYGYDEMKKKNLQTAETVRSIEQFGLGQDAIVARVADRERKFGRTGTAEYLSGHPVPRTVFEENRLRARIEGRRG